MQTTRTSRYVIVIAARCLIGRWSGASFQRLMDPMRESVCKGCGRFFKESFARSGVRMKENTSCLALQYCSPASQANLETASSRCQLRASPQGAEGWLASLRSQLLPALSTSCTICTADRHLHLPRQVPLRPPMEEIVSGHKHGIGHLCQQSSWPWSGANLHWRELLGRAPNDVLERCSKSRLAATRKALNHVLPRGPL
jgi:predicted Fe-S protein YdhL (DUF1289 family)